MAPTTLTQSGHTMSTLMKRSTGSDYSLYIFCIIAGCIGVSLIGFGLYTMYHGVDSTGIRDVSYEQRRYMREVRARNLNGFAVTAKRPDMIIPIQEMRE
ncbi:uncharacterized protein N7483_006814 [Penicillium malachiteum]|uniref:uncharacterized protein n=1 Tax=Penicillium malachiteum TaxID=1324776 RepID=UPI0025493580|nr:uncharacterized protein N7483_006814 [Penicillium malachiteum]KAJ5725457.1 hypothetical protein N7483_006814 [Penicillium malachiteum]